MKYLFLLIGFFIVQYISAQNKAVEFKNTAVLIEDSLWMLETEVSNAEYANFVESQTNKSMLLPNDSLWELISSRLKPLENYYSSHPAYQNFPVVNVTKEQVEKFCAWKTQQINAYLAEQMNESLTKVIVRLPTEKEWEFAACGKKHIQRFPWKGYSMRFKNGKYKGLMRCNYADNRNYFMLNSAKEIHKENCLTPIYSYQKNDIGLYNMIGNAAELIGDKDVVKGGHFNAYYETLFIEKSLPYFGAAPTIGFRYVVQKVQ